MPECIANSENFEIGLDQTYYAFAINMPQGCGDVNEDGSLDVLDIVLVVGIILGTSEPTIAQWFIGDLNSDDNIDILDIVIIVEIILES